jgi:hypothetical protein
MLTASRLFEILASHKPRGLSISMLQARALSLRNLGCWPPVHSVKLLQQKISSIEAAMLMVTAATAEPHRGTRPEALLVNDMALLSEMLDGLREASDLFIKPAAPIGRAGYVSAEIIQLVRDELMGERSAA